MHSKNTVHNLQTQYIILIITYIGMDSMDFNLSVTRIHAPPDTTKSTLLAAQFKTIITQKMGLILITAPNLQN